MPLFGPDWIDSFDAVTVNNTHDGMKTFEAKLADLLEDFNDLFEPGLGTLKDFKAHLYVKPDAKLTLHKRRPVALALKKGMEEDLKQLQDLGVIEPVVTAEVCATPIVAVPKPNGKVRVC